MTGVTPGVTCHQEVQHMRDGGGGEPHGPVWVPTWGLDLWKSRGASAWSAPLAFLSAAQQRLH